MYNFQRKQLYIIFDIHDYIPLYSYTLIDEVKYLNK